MSESEKGRDRAPGKEREKERAQERAQETPQRVGRSSAMREVEEELKVAEEAERVAEEEEEVAEEEGNGFYVTSARISSPSFFDFLLRNIHT